MPASTSALARSHPLAAAARVVVLTLVAVLTLFATRDVTQLWWIVLLALAGLPAMLAPQHRLVGPLSRVAEVVVLGLAASQVAAVATVGGHIGGLGASAVLPYLAVPVTVTALRRRFREGAALIAVTAGSLLVAGAVTEVGGVRQLSQPGYLAVCAQWLILAALGLYAAGTLHRVMQVRHDSKPQPYAEATRLLTQLRTVARQLPGATLDPGGISEHLLEELRTVARTDRGAVLSASGGGRLVVLAQLGADRVDWETTIDADSAIADAWASQQSQTSARSQSRSHRGGEVSALIVPLVAGLRTVGLVVLETDTAHAYPPPVVAQVTGLTGPAALRLEAALLFDEVRSLATNEERQRLAREIHDGVAQELVMVGYGIDNALATVHDDAEETAESLRLLRHEVTRVITELRLSLFELRSEVDRHGGLAAAIAEYARTVGASGGLRVHLSLDESTARLPAATEAELLRIAQEAVTNARKHAGAANLWVTCEVDPPYAQIEVSDDGHGIGDQRSDGHYGLAIMAERAERIRGRLEIRPRQPSGTTVAVVVGSPPRRDNVRGSAAAAEGE
ncbi:GAF domain-containing sensor histidine kinase [Verrucosispora sp. WMMD703]|uniref:GAF domain-containing sensor histidine kinase n=1 Tax=Micromonospora TaxID=1873 RepID=UPI0008EE98BC|nr:MULTISPECIES: GAF domain-containing sensor histidine kinase [Micromonospora]WFE47208.1 GAF domain-containing sensor histidine kinase [Verrucosispora sp. WMMD1129]SFB78932.1 Histidine kinase-, DNA gyrase B-, and HSP90-like ATPase [Micromonospora sediminimaris]